MGVCALIGYGAAAPAAAGYEPPLLVAQAETESPKKQRFDIPAQALSSALTEFGRETGLQVAVKTEQVADLRTKGVRGRLTAKRALTKLLAGTGLVYRFSGNHTVTLRRSGAEGGKGSSRLGDITVRAMRESPVGPDATLVPQRTSTASKLGTAVERAPRSISIVTTDELEERPVRDLNDALDYTAGVFTDYSGQDDRFDLFKIRGFDQGQSGSYRDGLERRLNGSFLQSRAVPYGIQRVEVLKGSTSSLYGQNSPGGMINLITKRPTDYPMGEVFIGAGTQKMRQGGFDAGGPLTGDGAVLGRLTALVQDGETQLDFSQDDRVYIAPALTWRPTDATSLTVLTNYTKTEAIPAAGVPRAGSLDSNPNGEVKRSFFSGDPDFNRYDTEEGSVGYQFRHAFSEGVELRQNARFTWLSVAYDTVYGLGLQPDQRTLNRAAYAVDGQSRGLVADTQLHVDRSWEGVANKTVFGVDISYDETDEEQKYGTATTIDVYDPDYSGDSVLSLPPFVDDSYTETNLGVYVSDELTLDDRWVLNLGGRYDLVRQKTEDHLVDETAHHKDKAFTGRVGMSYVSDLGLVPYVSYAQSFQPRTETLASGGQPDPEEGVQYEAGLKYRPNHFNALFTLAAFQIEESNRLVYVGPAYEQRGEFRVRGAELEARVDVGSGWSFVGTGSLLESKITEGANKGKETTRMPEVQASTWLSHRFRPKTILEGLKAGVGVRYIGKTWGNEANTLRIPSHTVVDASASYALDEDVDLTVDATNILDREYISTCYPSFSACYYGDERSVTAKMRYHW
ncbi:TonB-dependent siderophore receptor [Thiohalorhabdus sp. Cl-TMA]|uniref:TonB-dependent siderophore receptor n=1 Tax=Thiohalorhabdus methylotrophus TaxID=3242694 RepID=A0ABV4TYN9_9GAMM